VEDRAAPGDRYTHGHHDSVLRSHRWRTAENSAAYLLSYLEPGHSLLDVGCGPGTITVDLARRVAPGRVVAIDAAAGVVDQARAAVADAELANVTVELGDVYQLGAADGEFDVVHAHQVLQHLSDPVAALREMRRVCADRGVVAVRDGDYEAFTWYPANAGLDRWLEVYREVARRNGGEPDAGRHLLAWAHAAGFEDVRATASAWCFATDDDRSWWAGTWAERVTSSALAEHAVEFGVATRDELEAMAAAWSSWAAERDGWFAVLHSEIVCRA
jgi:SAM-dependent methyltransferase